MPESARALCRIVSLTAAKTRRMLDVSVACVRLFGGRVLDFVAMCLEDWGGEGLGGGCLLGI